MKKINVIVLMGLSVSALNACSVAQEQFDFSKKAPDEFAIITRAPLEMPTNLNQLPAPRPGIERPQETAPEQQAKQTLFGGEDKAVGNELTSGESILLQKSGAGEVDPNIRRVVDQETEKEIKENTSTFNRILGRAGKKTDVPTTVVDPVKESQRIQQNKTDGKPITDGKTPTIEQ